MRLILLSMYLLFTAVSFSYSADADTSYGDYRVKEKERERARGGSGDGRRNLHESDTDTSSSLFSGCFDPCFNSCLEIAVDGFKGIGHAVAAGYDPLPGKTGYDQFAEPLSRYAVGMGAGMLDYPGIASGFQIKLFNHFYLMPSHPVNLRANIGLDFSINSITADFERDVFVDTGRIGVQTVAAGSYANIAVPLLAELVVRPFGREGSFHAVIGGGAEVLYERIKGVKTATFNTQMVDTVCSAYHIRPALSLGIGWLMVAGRKFNSFELHYVNCFSGLGRREPLPGENASNSHSMTIDFAVVF
jgi:hypothetical protein